MGETHKTAEDTEGQGHGTPRALPDDEGAGPSGNSQFR